MSFHKILLLHFTSQSFMITVLWLSISRTKIYIFSLTTKIWILATGGKTEWPKSELHNEPGGARSLNFRASWLSPSITPAQPENYWKTGDLVTDHLQLFTPAPSLCPNHLLQHLQRAEAPVVSRRLQDDSLRNVSRVVRQHRVRRLRGWRWILLKMILWYISCNDPIYINLFLINK